MAVAGHSELALGGDTPMNARGGGFLLVMPPNLAPDILYVGDETDNTVKSFSAQDGKKGAFVTENTTGRLVGPMGLLIAGPELIVVNQHVNLPVNGEILQYQLKDESLTGAWVPSSDPNAPFAPRGAALKDGIIYVAEFVGDDSATPGCGPGVCRKWGSSGRTQFTNRL